MTLLVGALTTGLILALLGLGVFITYRVFDTLDLTADGSFGVGAATAAALLVHGISPVTATVIATAGGMAAGCVSGILHTQFNVSTLLAGILTSTALYSGNLFIMDGGNVSLASATTLVTIAEQMGARMLPSSDGTGAFGTGVSAESVATLALVLLLVGGASFALALFFRTRLGLAMRATGDNPKMARAVAINVEGMLVLGLALSNGLIALSGALFAQYQGFANIEMGIGMVVTGLASMILGETLLGKRRIGRWIAGVVVGSVLFRLLVAGAIRAGLNPNALKLVTAAFVLAALSLPDLVRRIRRHRVRQSAPTHA